MNTVYLRFLAKNVLKKWSFWIIGFLYILFTGIFVLMVPAILKTTPFVIWSNTMMSPQIMLMYAGALLSAILSIAIFRDYRDNGTELIMVSKPINRQKIIFAKLLIFIITSIGFALVSCIVCVFTLGFKEVNGYQTFSLVISTFIANAIFCLIFGFIATVISLFLNKIWTILLNIVFVVLMVIFHMVSQFTIKTPATLATDDGYMISSIRYANRNGQPHSSVVILPNIDMKTLSIWPSSVNDERNIWNDYRGRSHVGTANYFDFVSQFQLINNEFGLQDYMSNESDNSFGSNRWYDYTIDQPVASSTTINPDVAPLFYVQITPFTTPSDASQLSYWNTVFNLIANEDIILLGSAASAGSLIPTGVIQSSKGFFIANGHPGNLVSRNNAVYYSWDDLLPTTAESTVFNDMYNSLIANNNIFKGSRTFTTNRRFDAPWLSDTQSDWSAFPGTVSNIYDFIHYQLMDGLSAKITNPDILMLESLKFRFFLFKEISNNLFTSYYANSMTPFAVDGLPISLPGAPLLPSSDDTTTNIPNVSNWNSTDSYFNNATAWKNRALVDFAIKPQTIGYSSLTDYSRDYSHSSQLLTTPINFTLGYESLMATFTSTPTFKAWIIAIDWLLATTIIGIIATFIYWKTDFK